jgi:hypothetical protein
MGQAEKDKAETFRKRARELREMAKQIDSQIRQDLLLAAVEWERLAQAEESRPGDG